jgi:hypothetical protein
VKIGSKQVVPMGLAVSKIDRLAWNSYVSKNTGAGGQSALYMDNSVGSDNINVNQFDSYFGDSACSNYEFNNPRNDYSHTSLGNTDVRYRTSSYTAYSVFDINSVGVDTTS